MTLDGKIKRLRWLAKGNGTDLEMVLDLIRAYREQQATIRKQRAALEKIRDWNITDCEGPELRMQNARSYRLAKAALEEEK